jgi:histidinol-phosphate phosphatase family protein
MVLHPSNHIFDSDIIETDVNMRVKKIHAKPHVSIPLIRNLCNSGMYVLERSVLSNFDVSFLDFDRQILPSLIERGLYIMGWQNIGYIRDMGTPKRLEEVRRKLLEGKLSNSRGALFIDRDGTLNKPRGLITSFHEIELYEDAVDLIRKCNESGMLVIVTTNQPVIARGLITEKDLNRIHSYIDLLLSESSAYVDDYIFCPHHPDSGYEGEIVRLKTLCSCRKPGNGLILEAQRRFPIDLNRSLVVGDELVDRTMAESLNLSWYLVDRKGTGGENGIVSSLSQVKI